MEPTRALDSPCPRIRAPHVSGRARDSRGGTRGVNSQIPKQPTSTPSQQIIIQSSFGRFAKNPHDKKFSSLGIHPYASMLIENEAKETLKNFMIKSSKGKADQEDKVLSLQKLYV